MSLSSLVSTSTHTHPWSSSPLGTAPTIAFMRLTHRAKNAFSRLLSPYHPNPALRHHPDVFTTVPSQEIHQLLADISDRAHLQLQYGEKFQQLAMSSFEDNRFTQRSLLHLPSHRGPNGQDARLLFKDSPKAGNPEWRVVTGSPQAIQALISQLKKVLGALPEDNQKFQPTPRY